MQLRRQIQAPIFKSNLYTCPKLPLATSTKFNLGVGCPSISDEIVLSFSKSDVGKFPASAHAASYII